MCKIGTKQVLYTEVIAYNKAAFDECIQVRIARYTFSPAYTRVVAKDGHDKTPLKRRGYLTNL